MPRNPEPETLYCAEVTACQAGGSVGRKEAGDAHCHHPSSMRAEVEHRRILPLLFNSRKHSAALGNGPAAHSAALGSQRRVLARLGQVPRAATGQSKFLPLEVAILSCEAAFVVLDPSGCGGLCTQLLFQVLRLLFYPLGRKDLPILAGTGHCLGPSRHWFAS